MLDVVLTLVLMLGGQDTPPEHLCPFRELQALCSGAGAGWGAGGRDAGWAQDAEGCGSDASSRFHTSGRN